MNCKKCNSKKLIDGIIEGVSFVPYLEEKKKIGSGVYGIKTTVCADCGNIVEMSIDVETLKKIIEKKKLRF